MLMNLVTIDLRNDQRHIGIHAKHRGVVDYNRAALTCDRHPFARDFAACAEKCEVDVVEGAFIELFDGHGLAAEPNRFTSRSRRTDRPQVLHWKSSPLQHAQ